MGFGGKGQETFSNSGAGPMKIEEIIPKDNFLLLVKAKNGRTGLFDVKPFLNGEAFQPLRDRAEFQRVRNGGYFVEWDCGADLSADTIEARWEIVPENRIQEAVPMDA